MLVNNLLEEIAENFPKRNAVWDRGTWYSYSEINQKANMIAACLQNFGIKRGQQIALLLENSFNYVAAYFGILKAGGVVVGLNTDTNKESLTYLLNNSEAAAIIANSKYTKYLAPSLEECKAIGLVVLDGSNTEPYRKLPGIKTVELEDIYSDECSFNPPRMIDIDLAEIVYTSGSTGKPKGVMLSHLNLLSNMSSICNYLKLTEKDSIMVILPFYYIYGKSLLLTHFMVGGSVVIDNRFMYPNKIIETMKEIGTTGFAGVPSTFSILLNRSNLKNSEIPSLRYVTQAGGAMAPAVQKEVVEAFNPAELFIMYGATEAAPRLSYLDPEKLFSKWGSIGKPVDNVDLVIMDESGNELPAGETGEIAARGSNIMMGYWKEPEETAEVLKNGFYFTGDLGKKDAEGFFYVVGRAKDIIKVKGFRVGAKEIEEIILEIDEIHETAVVGINDDILGEAILSLIIPKEKGWADSEKILSHLKQKLPQIKLPKYIEFRDSFPKNESGKILKSLIKEQENKVKRN